ncbi:MAG TPA: carboxypeptidase-like regulatory domain-containing protein, partial [Pyrinomonadaceae bacterium]|nr:carboxypeptidase-like regulatory domain-containing protein [Pyrinomonadaceae bacterium]
MRLIIFCSLILFSLASTARPQAANSELIGEVRDQNGALVSNSKITLTDVSTGQTASKISTDGTFIITNLKPGI